jgi:hypothetical protein
MNRTISLAAPAFMLLCILAHPQSVAQNLVPNPYFEEGTEENGTPYGWEYKQNFVSPASQGEAAGIWDTQGFKGGRSISIAEKRWFSSSQWGCTVEDIQPHTWYIFSIRAMRDTNTGWLPKLHIFEQSRLINLKRPGRYCYFEFLLYSGDVQGTSELSLIVYNKPAKIWFDDLRLTKFCIHSLTPKDSEPADNPRTYFSWSMPEHGQALNYTLQLYRDGSQDPYYIKKGIEEPSYRGPVLEPGRYKWRVSAHSGAVLLAESETNTFKVTESSETADVSPDEPIPYLSPMGLRAPLKEFPVGVSGLVPEDAKDAADAGINWVFLPSDPAPYIRAGMKIIGHMNSQPADIYYLYDEPEQGGILPKQVRKKHHEARLAGPEIPTAISIYYTDRYMEYAGTSDIIMVDPYPVPVRPLRSVPEAVTAAKQVRGDMPVWAIIQAFDWADCSAEAARKGIARLPTYEEIRAMAYMAVAAGAEGLVFYTVGTRSKHHDTVMEMLQKLASELKTREDFLTAPGGNLSQQAPFYIFEKTLQDKKRHILVVNSESSPAQFGEELIEPYGIRLIIHTYETE